MLEPRLIELKLNSPPLDLTAYATAVAGQPRPVARRPDASAATSRRHGDAPAAAVTPSPTPPIGDRSFACPACGAAAGVDAVATDGLVTCSGCGGQFFAVARASDEDRAETDRLDRAAADRQQRLSDIHIKKIVVERRYQFRTRSYHVVALGAALALVYNLIERIVREVRFAGFGLSPAAYALASVALLIFAYLRWARIVELTAELSKPLPDAMSLDDPATPPDFSTLSDGSQSWKNLERMQGE